MKNYPQLSKNGSSDPTKIAWDLTWTWWMYGLCAISALFNILIWWYNPITYDAYIFSFAWHVLLWTAVDISIFSMIRQVYLRMQLGMAFKEALYFEVGNVGPKTNTLMFFIFLGLLVMRCSLLYGILHTF